MYTGRLPSALRRALVLRERVISKYASSLEWLVEAVSRDNAKVIKKRFKRLYPAMCIPPIDSLTQLVCEFGAVNIAQEFRFEMQLLAKRGVLFLGLETSLSLQHHETAELVRPMQVGNLNEIWKARTGRTLPTESYFT